MKNKIVAALIVENERDMLPITLPPLLEHCDAVVVVDGGSKDGTVGWLDSLNEPKLEIIENEYLHNDIGANGKQRNVYLEYLKQRYINWWCLVVDADEYVDFGKDFDLDFIDCEVVNPRMRHFQYCLGLEDATKEKHYCLARLFRISKGLKYPEVEHPVLVSGAPDYDRLTFWHLGYAREMIRLRDKYVNHLRKSNIHSPEFLKQWYLAHISGAYPTRKVDLRELPLGLKKDFDLQTIDDEIYFSSRPLEIKHFIEAREFHNEFAKDNMQKMLEVGCGLGHRLYAQSVISGTNFEYYGLEISQFAVNKCPYPQIKHNIICHDITKNITLGMLYDFVLMYDILEHVAEEELPNVLKTVYGLTAKNGVLVTSIPYLGDPNLELDPTHKTKKSKEWWVETIKNSGFKVAEPPEWWNYKEQKLVLTK